MKTYKPYLSLSKNITKYELGVIVSAVKNQTIVGIRQEEVKSDNGLNWGVIITISDAIPMVNGPENPIFSATVDIALETSVKYKKIVCSTVISVSDGKYGSDSEDETSIDFGDVNP